MADDNGTSGKQTAVKRINRKVVTLLVIILALAAVGSYLAYKASDAMGPMVGSNGNEVGGRFRLMDASDGTMTDNDFLGRWMLVMFGAVHCVDDGCTRTLDRLSDALKVVDPEGRKVAPIFVSLDPDRDISSRLRQYASQFSAKVVAGTGSPATLEAVTKEYHATIEKRPDPEWGYAYVMSPRIVIMNPEGRYAGTMESSASTEEMEARLKSLLAQH